MKTPANPRRAPRRWADRDGATMLIYVTCPGRRVALRIARAAVGERLAACANLIGPMRSLFRWQGRVQAAEEVVLILKTTRTLRRRLGERVAALHPYTVPCVVALPIAGGHAPFLDWIAAATAPARASR